MPFAEINDISMHYHDEGTGIPVVLVTGFSGDTTFFKGLIPDLVDEGYRVITFDNRGAGLTSYPMKKGIHSQFFVDDLTALIDHLGIKKAHFLGWSMGAHIMQEFAVQHPERLLSLTLISAYAYRPARSSYFMNGICDCAVKGGSPEYISMMTNAFCFTEDFFSGLEAKGLHPVLIGVSAPLLAGGAHVDGKGASVSASREALGLAADGHLWCGLVIVIAATATGKGCRSDHGEEEKIFSHITLLLPNKSC